MSTSKRSRFIRYAAIAIMGDLLSSIFTIASAQSTTSTSSAGAASASPKVHVVAVGPSGDFTYSPNVTTAAVGDIVSFLFYPSNHSVNRGEYTGSDACGPGGCNPCVPYELIHPGKTGFHSDNVLTQVLPVDGKGVSFNITVNNTDPIWYYCTALTSCSPNGMVGVINPAKGTTVDKQIDAAKKAAFQLSPGQSWPVEGSTPGAETLSASSAASTASSSPSSTPSGVTHDHRLSAGAIAGISVGAAAVLLLAAALFYFVGRSKSYKDIVKAQSEGAAPSHAGENMSQWSPAGRQTPSVAGGGHWDNRYSQQTAYSQTEAGQFVGFNRQTGAPEFASEAPSAVMMGEKAPGHYPGQSATPPPGHPAFTPSPPPQHQQAGAYELPAELAPVAEIGPPK